jgi:hypothetical protein
MSITKPALALALSLATLFAPLSADARGTRTHTRTKIVGYTTVASWDYTEGDVLTFVSVVVTENDLSGTAGKSTDAFVSLTISQSNISTGNVLISGRSEVIGPDAFDFIVDRQLGTARLVVNDAIFQDDNSFTFFDVDMDRTWTATADAVESKSHDKVKEPGIKFTSRFQGTFRDGVAQGSIFGKNIQFTPMASTSAQLQFNKFGSIEIVTETP